MEETDNEFDHDEPVVANIILPNRPHYSAVQVEEVGSFKLESTGGQNHLSAEDGSASSTVRQGIIDEVDSDTGEHTSTAFRRTILRNVSIVSATSEDEQQAAAMMTAARDMSVDQIEENVRFENGHSNIRVTKTVIEEQQVVEVDENGVVIEAVVQSSSTRRVKFNDGRKEFTEEPRSTVLTVETSKETSLETNDTTKVNALSSKPPPAKQAKVWTVESVDEVEVPQQLSEDELRRQRIKDIRSRARKGSLSSKEASIDKEETAETIPIINTLINEPPLSAKTFEIHEKPEQSHIEKSQFPTNYLDDQDGSKRQCASAMSMEPLDEEDAFMASLLQRGQAQRAALQQILSHEENSAEVHEPQQDWKESSIKISDIDNVATRQVPENSGPGIHALYYLSYYIHNLHDLHLSQVLTRNSSYYT